SSTKTYPLYTPKPLWAEQDPEDWWKATVETVADVIEKSGINASEIKGIGISGQMHGSVFLDENNNVVRPAILWCDQRTQKECDWITETVGKDKIIEFTCNPVLTGFTAGKVVWLRNNELDNYKKVKKVLLPKDYIRFKLTGEFASEVSDASGTSFFNVPKRNWAWEILDAIDIPRDWMPKCYESPEVSGKVHQSAALATGLAEGTPVVGGGGDNAAGAVGNGVVESGIIFSTIGTSGVVFAFSDEPVYDPDLRVHTFCHAVPGKWHQMGVMLSAGGSLRWYRDTFADTEMAMAKVFGKDPYEIICDEAAMVPAGSEGLIFLPYLTGERTPHADPHAKGVFFGISLRHDKAHFARAVLEGVAYGIRDSFDILAGMNIPIKQVRAGGGGARSELWRQINADVSGHDHSTINVDEGPGLGAALLAGVGTGVYKDVHDACSSVVKVTSTTKTNKDTKAVYDKYYNIYRTLYHSLKDSFSNVSNIVSE
ncbi:MAG: xylulokinase, partial [Armatimonadota bacterium]